jgi:phospholipid N-methyltransferase
MLRQDYEIQLKALSGLSRSLVGLPSGSLISFEISDGGCVTRAILQRNVAEQMIKKGIEYSKEWLQHV